MATSRSGYCRVCKIGTLDGDGLCVLCGAPSVPLSPPRRAVGSILAALTSLPALAMYAVLLAGGATVALWNYLGPDRAPALLRVGPPGGGGLSGGVIAVLLLIPAVLALIVMLVLFLLGRRGARPSKIGGAAETY
jgi:hypothetical protein